VEHQFHRCAGGIFVVAAMEFQSVKGCDIHIFVGHSPDFLHPTNHLIPKDFVDLTFGDRIVVNGDRAVLGYKESQIKTNKSSKQNQYKNCCDYPK
jgi:hypothetical protein